jgi:hypothetical protein
LATCEYTAAAGAISVFGLMNSFDGFDMIISVLRPRRRAKYLLAHGLPPSLPAKTACDLPGNVGRVSPISRNSRPPEALLLDGPFHLAERELGR